MVEILSLWTMNKHARFSSELAIAEAPDYDRTACLSDIFNCDVCGIRIPAGIKGFEPYGTCRICPDGFDACGACCGTKALMRICNETAFTPDARPQTMRSKCHKHVLVVVDRRAEILWANSSSQIEKPKNGKRSRGSRSSSPRKTAKLVSAV